LDDNCNGQINENCNGGNDNSQFPTNMQVGLTALSCLTTNGTLLNATSSPSIGGSWVSAPDVWYYFTATSPGVSIQAATTVNDLRLEIRNMAGTLLKSSNDLSGVGTEYLNYGGLTSGTQYLIRVMNMNSSQAGGNFVLCAKRLVSSSGLYYTTPALFVNGCEKISVISAYGASNYVMTLTPTLPAGGASLSANGQIVPLSSFVGSNGEMFNFNTVYSIAVTVTYVLPLGNSTTENISVSSTLGSSINVGAHEDLDLASMFTCPYLVGNNWTVRASSWICGAQKYQWRFEKYANGVPVTVAGQPVVVEMYGIVGTRDIVISALNGFTSGTEWRVQIRPIMLNGAVGSYGTDYQCMKMKGTAKMAENNGELTAQGERKIEVYPNPGRESKVQFTSNDQASFTGEIALFDITGKLVGREWLREVNLNGLEITFPGVQSGCYWIRVTGNDWHDQIQWIKE
jgi:hypothetical protein